MRNTVPGEIQAKQDGERRAQTLRGKRGMFSAVSDVF